MCVQLTGGAGSVIETQMNPILKKKKEKVKIKKQPKTLKKKKEPRIDGAF